MIKTVIFDVDGTLVDTVDMHAEAWQRALKEFDKEVEFSAVREQIGKGGDQLMPVFLSQEELDQFGEELEKRRGEIFKRDYLPKDDRFPAGARIGRAHPAGRQASRSGFECKAGRTRSFQKDDEHRGFARRRNFSRRC